MKIVRNFFYLLRTSNTFLFISIIVATIFGVGIYFFISFIGSIEAKSRDRIYIFNPYQGDLRIQINKNEFLLKHEEVFLLPEFSEGKYQLKSFLSERKLVDTIIEIKKKSGDKRLSGVLNLSNQPLYKWSEVYELENSNEPFKPIELLIAEGSIQAVKIDTLTIIGNVLKIPKTRIFIKKDWDISLFVNYKEKYGVRDGDYYKYTGKAMTKLFTEEELKNYWLSKYYSKLNIK